jgi:hypothetical protein
MNIGIIAGIVIGSIIFLAATIIIAVVVHNKFWKIVQNMPQYKEQLDVSGKRNVADIIIIQTILGRLDEDMWKRLALNVVNYEERKIEEYKTKISTKKDLNNEKVQIKMQKYIDDFKFYCNNQIGASFVFQSVRNQTRYRQSNYVRTPYTVVNIDKTFYFSPFKLMEQYRSLNSIGLKGKDFKEAQRKLMTAELRNKIKERDNYTCRECGVFMDNELGLHIDHILPVSYGGKTEESNLQVLCSKCNGRKSNKIA